MKINIVDLANNLQFIKPYIELRNSFSDKLLCDTVQLKETLEWIKHNTIVVLVALEQEQLVGAVILYLSKDNEVSIFSKVSRKGIGTHLLQAIERVALKKQLPSLYSWIEDTNKISQTLFVKQKYISKRQSTKSHNNVEYLGTSFQKELST